MIRTIFGLNGTGKSLFMSWLMAQSTRQVVTNMELLPAHPKYESAIRVGTYEFPVTCEKCGLGIWDYGFRDCDIFLDEADINFDAFEFVKLRGRAWPFFKQHRKDGLDVFLGVQFVESLYNRLRNLGGEHILCSRDGLDDVGVRALVMKFIPDEWLLWRRTVYSQDMQTVRRTVFQTPAQVREVFPTYDTLQQFFPIMGCERCEPGITRRMADVGGRPGVWGGIESDSAHFQVVVA